MFFDSLSTRRPAGAFFALAGKDTKKRPRGASFFRLRDGLPFALRDQLHTRGEPQPARPAEPQGKADRAADPVAYHCDPDPDRAEAEYDREHIAADRKSVV